MNKETVNSGFEFEVRRTQHAEIRQQQRGIRNDLLKCLLAYGRREHDHAHCEIVFFDGKAIESIQRYEGVHLAHLASDHRDVYAVIDSDGCVVTAGHRFRRILRDKSLSNMRPGRGKSKRRWVSAQPASVLASPLWH